MTVALFGSGGSIGRRYSAILRYLGVEFEGIDLDCARIVEPKKSFDRAIVAVPTDRHYDYAKWLLEIKKPFLVEKPLSRHLDACENLVEREGEMRIGNVVCNYKYVLGTQKPILYDYYKTGSDGFLWDCCQLIARNPEIELRTTSPVWTLISENGPVHYGSVEASYIAMLRDFVNGRWASLDSLYDGMKMTQEVLKRCKS